MELEIYGESWAGLLAQKNMLNMLYINEVVGSVILILLPFLFYKRIHIAVLSLWSILILRQTLMVFWPLHERHLQKVLYLITEVSMAQSLIMMTLYPVIVWHFTKSRPQSIFIMALILMLDAWLIGFGWQGLCGGKSFDPVLLAILSPLLLGFLEETWNKHKIFSLKSDIFYFLIGLSPLVTLWFWIFLGKSLSACIVMSLSILSYLVMSGRVNRVFMIGITVLFGWACALVISLKSFSSFDPRIRLWKSHLHWWWDNFNHYIGDGLGVYQWIGPYIQTTDNEHYFALHNDYMEMLFEDGFLGFICILVFVSYALYRSRTRPALFSSVLGFSLAMCFYYPLHVFTGQMIALILLGSVFKQEPDVVGQNV